MILHARFPCLFFSSIFFFQICIFCIVFLAIGIAFTKIADLQNQNTNLNNQLTQQEQTYSGKIDELTVYQEKLVERISLLEENYSNCVRIPMKSTVRSLNLSNSVAIVLYEALRQHDYVQLKREGKIPQAD